MKWKVLGKKLLFPPIWVMLLLTILSTAALIWVFICGLEAAFYAYPIYVLAFYTLTAICIFCARVLPKRFRNGKVRFQSSNIGKKLEADPAFRFRSSLNLSLTINLLYIGLQGLQWFLFRSWWFVVLAGYYTILAVIWFLLTQYVHRRKLGADLPREWKRSRLCACILLLVNLTLSGAVLMILYQGRSYEYPGILIYVMAAYTFYSTIHAIVDLIKYRKLGSPILSTAKVAGFSAALVSMLNLETAMFSQFGKDMAMADRQIFIILTGAGISIAVITLSVLLITKATTNLRSKHYGA